MTTWVPVTVTAKNEARSLGTCLTSLKVAAARAEAELPVRIDLRVVLDDCTDATADVARASGVATATSTGGKVEAQRAGLREGLFNVFSDADIRVAPEVLVEVIRVMQARADVEVAFPRKRPLPPGRSTLLARALHAYNANHGYASVRPWFSGVFFAIRQWSVPTRAQLASRIATLPVDPFYDFAAGLTVDDIYLSRQVVRSHGPASLVEVASHVDFRAPETFEGMYRYYRRMRRELERTDLLFPETREVHLRFGRRVQDRLATAPPGERALHRVFAAALLACRARYRFERATTLRRPAEAWPVVEESKGA